MATFAPTVPEVEMIWQRGNHPEIQNCSGVSATWCGNCGQCLCGQQGNTLGQAGRRSYGMYGQARGRTTVGCPLHAHWAEHPLPDVYGEAGYLSDSEESDLWFEMHPTEDVHVKEDDMGMAAFLRGITEGSNFKIEQVGPTRTHTHTYTPFKPFDHKAFVEKYSLLYEEKYRLDYEPTYPDPPHDPFKTVEFDIPIGPTRVFFNNEDIRNAEEARTRALAFLHGMGIMHPRPKGTITFGTDA